MSCIQKQLGPVRGRPLLTLSASQSANLMHARKSASMITAVQQCLGMRRSVVSHRCSWPDRHQRPLCDAHGTCAAECVQQSDALTDAGPPHEHEAIQLVSGCFLRL